nr:KTSC domain-containing protein [uncultured Flavobacterium sp.]
MKKILFILVLPLAMISCGKKDCSDLESKYASQPEAVKAITSAKFQLRESQTTANSSSIKRVEYFSCDGAKGYLVVYNLSGDVFLHKDVPLDVWKGLKESEYMRNYYNDNLRDKYAY